MSVSITVTVSEGAFVYVGKRNDGTANWKFLRNTDRGPKPSAIPRRWEGILNRQKKRQDSKS